MPDTTLDVEFETQYINVVRAPVEEVVPVVPLACSHLYYHTRVYESPNCQGQGDARRIPWINY